MKAYVVRKGLIGWGLPIAAGLIVGHYLHVGTVTFDLRGFVVPVFVRLVVGFGVGLIAGLVLWAWYGRSATGQR